MRTLLTSLVALFVAGHILAAPKPSDEVYATATLSTINDLEALFIDCQYQHLPIAPPSEKTYVHSGEAIFPVDWKQFPKEFNKGMIVEMDANGFPLYRIAVYEDVKTRETVFLNGMGVEIYRLAPIKEYNPYAYQMDKLGITSFVEFEPHYEWIYDPARIAAEFLLIPNRLYEDYKIVQDEIRLDAISLTEPMTMAMSLPEIITDIRMGIAGLSNGTVEVQVGWPSGFSDQLEIYSATDLITENWQFAHTNIITFGFSNFYWIDSNTNSASRFYVTGNADIDEDGDGLASAREKYLYKTSASLFDTDGDGLGDGFELSYGFNPLSFLVSEALGDADQDGYSNLEEQKRGTDPGSPDNFGSTGTVVTIRYYYDEDDRLSDHFVGTDAAKKMSSTPAHNLSEVTSIQ